MQRRHFYRKEGYYGLFICKDRKRDSGLVNVRNFDRKKILQGLKILPSNLKEILFPHGCTSTSDRQTQKCKYQ